MAPRRGPQSPRPRAPDGLPRDHRRGHRRRRCAPTREIDDNLVNAQEARRILDRLVGFDVSKVLWRVLAGARSAGRVQSVAVRLVVERERERIAFRSATWWGVDAALRSAGGCVRRAACRDVAGEALADGGDFAENGALKKGATARVLAEDEALAVVAGLEGASPSLWPRSPRPRGPSAPARRSSRPRCRSRAPASSAGRPTGPCASPRSSTRPGGSPTCAPTRRRCPARRSAPPASAAPTLYGQRVRARRPAYATTRRCATPRRPTRRSDRRVDVPLDRGRQPLAVSGTARGSTSSSGSAPSPPRWSTRGSSAEQVRLTATHLGAGALAGTEVAPARDRPARRVPGLPPRVRGGERRPRRRSSPTKRSCCPSSPRGRVRTWSRVSAVLARDRSRRRGSPRPRSCAASRSSASVGRARTRSVVKVIKDRDYVWRKGTALVPSFTAFAVTNLLERYFAELVDYGFTAAMEDDLDAIAAGEKAIDAWLHPFYFGDDKRPDRARTPRAAARDPGRDRARPAVDLHHPRRHATSTASTWSSASAATARPCSSGEDRRPLPPRSSPTRSTIDRAARAARRGHRRPRGRPRPGQRAHRPRPPGPLRPLRPARERRRRRGPAEDGVDLPDDDPRDGDRRGGARTALAAPEPSAWTPRGTRSPRRTADTGRT